MSERENMLRTIRFEEPEWIPCMVGLSPGIWARHRERLEDIVVDFPSVFGEYERGDRDFDELPENHRAGEEFTDPWGCVWQSVSSGICGQPKIHPLEDWSALEGYIAPPPPGEPDLERMSRSVREARAQGRMAWGGANRFYERLMFLRSYRRLMMDFVLEPPELSAMIEIVGLRGVAEIEAWLKIGVDGIRWGDDLGAQDRPMISPACFGKYLLPWYRRMCRMARRAGCEAYMHSDGRILELMDLLLSAGFTVLNPQVTINEIDVLARRYKGKVCLDADVDRQHVLPRASPAGVHRHIEEIIGKLGSKEGGLMLIAGVYPDVPLENIRALCQAMADLQCRYA